MDEESLKKALGISSEDVFPGFGQYSGPLPAEWVAQEPGRAEAREAEVLPLTGCPFSRVHAVDAEGAPIGLVHFSELDREIHVKYIAPSGKLLPIPANWYRERKEE